MTTTTTTDFEQLAADARSRGTPILRLEPCEKCGCPYYYQRDGRQHNGCLSCHNDRKMANANQGFLTSFMLDENGVPVREGRACKECGNKLRIVERAYGTKNKGACRECAVKAHAEKEHGKEIKRVNRAVSAKVHKFIIQSIERSGYVEVAPRTQQEFFELRDLVYRCEVMNQTERMLNTGVRWELGHEFPAVAAGELRGKATLDNVKLVQYGLNKKAGNSVPDTWEPRQVVSIADCRQIRSSWEASQAWQDRKEWDKKLTPTEKKQHQAKEREANREHCERVKEIVGPDFKRVAAFFTADYIPRFEQMVKMVRAQWERVALKMTRTVDAYILNGETCKFVEVRGQKLTMEALCGAQSRLWVVVQTFDQLADAESILLERGLNADEVQQLDLVKRYAVQWADSVLSNPQVLVMGFSHPMLSVLGDWKVWGTEEAEDGRHWVCAWKMQGSNVLDRMTPFDDVGTELDPNGVNKALMANQGVPTSAPDESFQNESLWADTANVWVYEQRKLKAAREAREAHQRALAEQEAAKRKAEQEAAEKARERELSELMEGIDGLWWYADSEWSGAFREDAERLIESAVSRLGELRLKLAECKSPAEFGQWQASSHWEVKQLKSPEHVFADLIKPF